MTTGKRLIVFFIPPEKGISGGILSIFSICKTSRKFYDIHKSEIIACVYPGHKSYGQNDLFENDEKIYSFEDIVGNLTSLESLQLHVPEYASWEVFKELQPYKELLRSIPGLHINILNQNILIMPEPVDVAFWFTLTSHITQTTAHDKYSTQALSDEYDIPLHHLSTFVDTKQYKYRTFKEKENIILLSPDTAKAKSGVVDKIAAQFPTHKLITVENMRYEDYKDLMSRAQFAVTFGEGFDGYFVEAHFTGGIAFAVYNDDFFPSKSFLSFENVYASYTDMLKNITKDMKKFIADPAQYQKVAHMSLDAINTLYDYSTYEKNLEEFYLKHYTFIPTKGSAEILISKIMDGESEDVKKLELQIVRLTEMLKAQEANILETVAIVHDREKLLADMSASLSWRVTKPLRAVHGLVKRASSS